MVIVILGMVVAIWYHFVREKKLDSSSAQPAAAAANSNPGQGEEQALL